MAEKVPDKDRPPRGLTPAQDQSAAAEQQLQSLTAPTAACGTPWQLTDRFWPCKRSDYENPAASWVALVQAFDGGDVEEITGLIRLAKSSIWCWKELDRCFGAGVPATQPNGPSEGGFYDGESPDCSSNEVLLDDALHRDLGTTGSPLMD